MKIGLIDVDGHNFPNLALMKISAYHKAKGDQVEWWNGFFEYDKVYMAKVFDDTYSNDMPFVIRAKEIIRGGTGYNMTDDLPYEIEHIYPDYDLYGIHDTAYGFLSRGCPRNCGFCIVTQKEGDRAIKVADLSEWWRGQKYIELLDPNILACRDWKDLLLQLSDSSAFVNFNQGLDVRLMTADKARMINRIKYSEIHFAWDNPYDGKSVKRGLECWKENANRKTHGKFGTVYVLTNYGTSLEQDLERVYWLRDNGFDPFVMVYDKPNAPHDVRRLQRYVNNIKIFKTVERFEDYKSI